MDNFEWRNKNVFNYKDYDYGTQASISITLSKSINLDNRNTSNINVLMSINSSGMFRNVNLSYSNLYGLVSRLKVFVNKWTELKIKCGKKLLLIKEVNSDPKLISFFIYNSDSDFGNIVFDISTFMSICKLLSSVVDKYLDLDMSMDNEIQTGYMNSMLNNRIKNIEETMSLIKTKFLNESELKIPSESKEGLDTFDQINELDEFIGGNELSNISIDELSKEDRDFKISKELKTKEIVDPKKSKTVSSSFIEDVLKTDISNFENLIISICRETDPIQKFIDVTKMSMVINNDDFKFLPDLNEKDYKSSLYIGKLTFNTAMKKYLEQGSRILNNVSVIKYKPENTFSENIDLAYDLLLIMGYIKLTKEKLELKEDDGQTNKSVTYLATRCFTDILHFSFLNKMNSDMLKSCVLKRFETYKENNFFKSYERTLKNYGLTIIDKNDITKFLDSVCSKVLGNDLYIGMAHLDLYNNGNVKIPPNNKLTIEQMINDGVRLEIEMKLSKLDPEKYISDKESELGKYLLSKYPIIQKQTPNIESSVLRVINHFGNEIPSDLKSEFIEYITDIGNKKENIDYNKFELEKFGDNIVKAIYEWNNSNKEDSFKELFSKTENSLNKSEIIEKVFGKQDDTNNIVSSENIEDILSDLNSKPKLIEDLKGNTDIEEDWLSEISL